MLPLLLLALCSQALGAFPPVTFNTLLTPITTQIPDNEYYGLYTPENSYGWYCHWFVIDGKVKAFAAVAKNDQKRQKRWWPQLAWGELVTNATEASFKGEVDYPNIGFDNDNNDTISLLFDFFTNFPYDAEKGIIHDIWFDQRAKTIKQAAFDVKTGVWTTSPPLVGKVNEAMTIPGVTFVYKGDVYILGQTAYSRNPDFILRVYKDNTWTDLWSIPIENNVGGASYDEKTGNYYFIIGNKAYTGNVASASSPPKVLDIPLPQLDAMFQGIFLHKGYLLTFWYYGPDYHTFFTLYDVKDGSHSPIYPVPAPRPGCDTLGVVASLPISSSELWISLFGRCAPDSPSQGKLFVMQLSY